MISLAIPAIPALPPIPAAQQRILETIKQQQSFNRSYGECAYAWNQWKLSAEGIRSIKRLCKHEIEDIVAVSCSIFKVNTFEDGKWGQWRSPLAKEAKPGEDNMVAVLCANVMPETKP